MAKFAPISWQGFKGNTANGWWTSLWHTHTHKLTGYWKQTVSHWLLYKASLIKINEPETFLVASTGSTSTIISCTVPHPPSLHPPYPSLSRQLAPHQWQHRGSSLVENAQLYQLIFLSKTNYPSCMVRLTELALTPGCSGYWCDLVLAPRSAFPLLSFIVLLSLYAPSTHSTLHHLSIDESFLQFSIICWPSVYFFRTCPAPIFYFSLHVDADLVSSVRHRISRTVVILQKAHHRAFLYIILLLCSSCGGSQK